MCLPGVSQEQSDALYTLYNTLTCRTSKINVFTFVYNKTKLAFSSRHSHYVLYRHTDRQTDRQTDISADNSTAARAVV